MAKQSKLTPEQKQAEMQTDLKKCLADGVKLTNWLEDIRDEPDAYPYSADDLETFLFSLKTK